MGAGGGGGDGEEGAQWGREEGKAVGGGDVTSGPRSCSPSEVAERGTITLRAGPEDEGGGVEKRLISHARAVF